MSSVRFALYRLFRHMTRRKAAWGWVLAVIGLTLYATYPEAWWASEAIKQFSIIVASVAFGAVFLPEISSDLWTISSQDIRQLVPDERVAHLQEQIIRARVGEREWADRILDCAIAPLLHAAVEPHLIVGDLVYTAAIHRDVELDIDGRKITLHRVETSLRGRRVLPPSSSQHVYWVSLSRTAAHLEREFKEPGCLFREVVDVDDSLSDDEWRRVIESHSRARIVLDGNTVEATTTAPPGEAYGPLETQGLVRWYFDPSEIVSGTDHDRRTITLTLDYPLRPDRLVVYFGAYYTMGSAQITVRVYGGDDPVTINHDAFIARALDVSSVDVKELTKPGLCTELSVITSDRSLLWPGTGLSVWWSRSASPRPQAHQESSAAATPTRGELDGLRGA